MLIDEGRKYLRASIYVPVSVAVPGGQPDWAEAMRLLLEKVAAFEAKLKKDPHSGHKPREDTQFISTLEGLFAVIGYSGYEEVHPD